MANTRVDQHVEKGNDDGLYISSVACCQELWALIMDAGTGFTAQTYSLSNQFLPKEWIMVRAQGCVSSKLSSVLWFLLQRALCFYTCSIIHCRHLG